MLPADGSAASDLESATAEPGTWDLVVGLNVLGAPYGFALFGRAWLPVGGTGFGSQLPVDEWVPLKVEARGSTIDLYVT